MTTPMTKEARAELRITAQKAKDSFIPNFMVATRHALALLDALESSEKRIAEQREYFEGVIADGGKRIAELQSRAESAEQALLLERQKFAESNRMIVTLPQRQEPTSSGHYGEGYLVPNPSGSALDYEDTVDALSAAGITLQIQGGE